MVTRPLPDSFLNTVCLLGYVVRPYCRGPYVHTRENYGKIISFCACAPFYPTWAGCTCGGRVAAAHDALRVEEVGAGRQRLHLHAAIA